MIPRIFFSLYRDSTSAPVMPSTRITASSIRIVVLAWPRPPLKAAIASERMLSYCCSSMSVGWRVVAWLTAEITVQPTDSTGAPVM